MPDWLFYIIALAMTFVVVGSWVEFFIAKGPEMPIYNNSLLNDVPAGTSWQSEIDRYVAKNFPTTTRVESSLYDMLAMRMRWGKNPNPFYHCHPVRVDDKVIVFIIHDKQPTYLEDEWGMYPSDALITKLRLMAD